MSKHDKTCHRCAVPVPVGMPQEGTRFWATVTRNVYRIRFHRLVVRHWLDVERAADQIQSFTHSDVTLCDTCWGDVLHFIVTTRPKATP